MNSKEQKFVSTLGLHLRGERKLRKISVAQACEVIGFNERSFNRFESEGRGLSIYRFVKLTTFYGCDGGDLIAKALQHVKKG